MFCVSTGAASTKRGWGHDEDRSTDASIHSSRLLSPRRAGCGTFRDVRVLEGSGISPVVGDFNGDGKQDVALSAVRKSSFDWESVMQPFGSRSPFHFRGRRRLLQAGDVNRDGWTDLIVSQPKRNTGLCISRRLTALPRQGLFRRVASKRDGSCRHERGWVSRYSCQRGRKGIGFFTDETTECSHPSTCFLFWEKEDC